MVQAVLPSTGYNRRVSFSPAELRASDSINRPVFHCCGFLWSSPRDCPAVHVSLLKRLRRHLVRFSGVRADMPPSRHGLDGPAGQSGSCPGDNGGRSRRGGVGGAVDRSSHSWRGGRSSSSPMGVSPPDACFAAGCLYGSSPDSVEGTPKSSFLLGTSPPTGGGSTGRDSKRTAAKNFWSRLLYDESLDPTEFQVQCRTTTGLHVAVVAQTLPLPSTPQTYILCLKLREVLAGRLYLLKFSLLISGAAGRERGANDNTNRQLSLVFRSSSPDSRPKRSPIIA